eukprot:TRINITY_DN265_c0_g3_i1.p1 TRINITY_DN265_c0_g3~~TRINITY_DN265_c0_g3_i1.p1  ORF type:complete len:460 (+),score=108.30 TRINITY_DN265_c0_g3_i1:38-1381(+)
MSSDEDRDRPQTNSDDELPLKSRRSLSRSPSRSPSRSKSPVRSKSPARGSNSRSPSRSKSPARSKSPRKKRKEKKEKKSKKSRKSKKDKKDKKDKKNTFDELFGGSDSSDSEGDKLFGGDSDEDQLQKETNDPLQETQPREEINIFNSTEDADEMDQEEDEDLTSNVVEDIEFTRLPYPKEDLSVARLPNFLALETRPFVAQHFANDERELKRRNQGKEDFEKEKSPLEGKDVIRWRQSLDDEGDFGGKESNSRFVRWSDGSWTLHVGSEVFMMKQQPIESDHYYMFARQKGFIQSQGQYMHRLLIQQSSLGSKSHQSLTNSIMKRHQKNKKISFLSSLENPEAEKQRLEKEADEKLQMDRHMKRQKRKVRGKFEGDEDDSQEMSSDFLTGSGRIKDIKKKSRQSTRSPQQRKKKTTKRSSSQRYSDDSDEDEESEGSFDEDEDEYY